MVDLCLVFRWWSENRTEKSLSLVQNVWYLNGPPSHVTLPFDITDYTVRLEHLALILLRLGIVLNIRTPHPITGMHRDSRVGILV